MNEYKTRQDKTRQDKTRQDKTRQDKLYSGKNGGFISVVAMIIFAILIVTGLSVQRSNIDRLQNIRNTTNYFKAKYLSESVMGKINQMVEKSGPGFSDSFECSFTDGNLMESQKGSTTELMEDISFCNENFGILINPCGAKNTGLSREECDEAKYTGDIKINAEIAGKTTKEVSGCGFGFSSACYTIPEIGQGTAGNRSLMPEKNDPTRDCSLYNTEVTPDLNHECNWNRLSFGSSSTDRVVIPMYYTNSEGVPMEYHKNLSPGVPHFVLRVRTPCKDWKKDGTCNNRYELDTLDGNDIVLQWQITGKCIENGNEMDCGILPWISYNASGTQIPTSSAIDEARVNGFPTPFAGEFEVLSSSSGLNLFSINTLTYNREFLNQLFKLLSKPSINIFLNKPLISVDKKRIPYLEYQFLTPSQISNPESKLSVFASFDGNSSSNTIYKSIQGALIDFAIQN